MSGAVGAMWRQWRVDSRIESRVAGGETRYLNMSLRGWPEFTSTVREIGFGEPGSSDPAPRRRYVGLVSQKKEGIEDTEPIMARGNGCWGRMTPDGSVSPARIWMGMTEPMSFKWPARMVVGCEENVDTSCPYLPRYVLRQS